MIDSAVTAFFDQKRAERLKKFPQSTEDELEAIFLLENWLPNAARRARQMSLATHPCTFSHPSARKNNNGYVTPVIAETNRAVDGYLRTGNVQVDIDALGNAAALDVYKFLNIEMEDSRKLINHIQEDTEAAVALLTIQAEPYEKLKSGFLEMVASDDKDKIITSSKIKQVYFPVSDSYHQLSLISSSGMIYELKKRINEVHFSEKSKDLKEKKRKRHYSDQGFSEFYNLTVIGYGGTKPQNISVLNTQNGGKGYLLLSVPPTLKRRDIRHPKGNFFEESLNCKSYREIFNAIHKIFKIDYNNKNIRNARDNLFQELIDHIIERMRMVRLSIIDKYHSDKSVLKSYQKIWLYEQQAQKESDEWLDTLCEEMARWIVNTYEKLLGKQAYKLSDVDLRHIRNIINNNREVFRW